MACIRCFRSFDSFSRLALKRLSILQSRRFYSSQNNSSEKESPYSFPEEEEEERRDEFEDEDEALRDRILAASLQFVPQHGWTRRALQAGGESESLPPVAHGMFPRGGADLVFYFYHQCNTRLAGALKTEVESLQSEGGGHRKPKTRPFIENAVQSRLKMIVPHIEQWPQAMAIQMLPQNAFHSWRHLSQLCDDIWFYAGDRSTDFNWYTKRASLAAVYKSTEIYMLQDRSVDFTDTWTFLDRRLDNLQTFGKTVRNMDQTGAVMGEGIQGMITVGRNLLGMNSRNR